MSTQRITDVPISNGVSSVFVNDENKLRQVPFGDFSSLFNFAPTIINEKSGESIIATDSSNDKFRGMNVYGKSTQRTTTGKQLFDASGLRTTSSGGATVTNNGDGSFTVSGSDVLSEDYQVIYDYSHEDTVKLLKAGVICLRTETITRPYVYVQLRNDSTLLLEANCMGSTSSTKQVTQEMLDDANLYMRIGFYASTANETITAGTVKPMLYQDGDGTWEEFSGGKPSPSPDYPQPLVSVGESGSVAVSVCGKNLIPYPFVDTTKTEAGVTFTDNGDGSITASGTSTAGLNFYYTTGFVLPAGKYKLWRGGNFSGMNLCAWKNKKSGSTLVANVLSATGCAEFEITADEAYDTVIQLQLNHSSGGQTISGTCYCMITDAAVTDASYEPYKPAQTLTALTPNGLPGIPVTSGGNYTDKNGQMWVCDEIDMERGVYVQRIGVVILDGVSDGKKTHGKSASNVNTNTYLINTSYWNARKIGANVMLMCSHYRYTGTRENSSYVQDNCIEIAYSASTPNTTGSLYIGHNSIASSDAYNSWLAEQFANGTPVIILYELATPIETPLTAEQIEAYKALHSNYPTTTILNNNGAGMMVKYGADTKLYIDNKFAELAAQLV